MTAIVLSLSSAGSASAAMKNFAIAVRPSARSSCPISRAVTNRMLRSRGHPHWRLQIVVAAAAAIVIQVAAALELVHRLVELRPTHLVAHLLAHLSERARDAPGVVLVDVGEARGIR